MKQPKYKIEACKVKDSPFVIGDLIEFNYRYHARNERATTGTIFDFYGTRLYFQCILRRYVKTITSIIPN